MFNDDKNVEELFQLLGQRTEMKNPIDFKSVQNIKIITPRLTDRRKSCSYPYIDRPRANPDPWVTAGYHRVTLLLQYSSNETFKSRSEPTIRNAPIQEPLPP